MMCTTVLHGGVCHHTSTPHKSGEEEEEDLQTILSKSADQQAPPELDIANFGWEIKDGIPVPTTSDQPPGSQDIMDVVRCGCKAEGTNAELKVAAAGMGRSHAQCTAHVHAVMNVSTHSRKRKKVGVEK